MKNTLKDWISKSGLWALYDEWQYQKVKRELSKDKCQFPESWRLNHFSPKGDTFFILGSGYSVNDVTSDQWRMVKDQFSIGFNHWFFHDFVPDIYGFEQPKNQLFCDAQMRAMNNANPQHFQIPLFLHFGGMSQKGAARFSYPWDQQNIYRNLPFTLHSNNRSIIRKYIRKSVRSKSLSKLLHYSASVSVYMDIGIRLGYKKFVLVGFDMNDPRYFYESTEYSEKSKEILEVLSVIHKETGRNQTKHATVDSKITSRYGCLPVDQYIYLFRDELKAIDSEFEIYVGSSKSKMAEQLPIYPW